MGIGTASKVKPSLRQVTFQWALGMFVATPVIAVLQGTYQLSEYRIKHANAPRPVMPARGVAVAVKRGIRPFLNTQKPLRLLVVGDSLAAGVGMSKSGTPVLPESIARSLSKNMGGRAVYWTCVGTPGVSASQIVQDIHQLEPHKPGQLEKLFREWQVKRRKWQERQELRRRLTELEHDTTLENSKPMLSFLRDWWDSVQADKERSARRVRETTTRVVQAWWTQVTDRFRATRQRVEEDITDIKDIVQNPQGGGDADAIKLDGELIHKGNVFHRDTLDPQVAAQYDVAVVLTGLNDLKDAFMPHMTAGAKSSLKEGTERVMGGLRNQLRSVLRALDEKMDLDPEEPVETNRVPGSDIQNLRRPLVVVPELPIAPLSLFQLVPLSWFLIPLFRAMENNKKLLSTSFPDYVVFIPQPDLQWWEDAEAGFGPIKDAIKQERLLLRTTDIAQNALERIQDLMKQHYHPETEENIENKKTKETSPNEDTPHAPGGPEVVHSYEGMNDQRWGNSNQKVPKSSRSQYVAVDKMHPNDEGYELWGRHIAAAILEHWNR